MRCHSLNRYDVRTNLLFQPCCTVILAVVCSAITKADTPQLAPLHEYIKQAMDQWQVPGLAISIVKDDEVILAQGFGVRKIGEAAPVDERTLFAIGSTSKAFTATALGILQDEGKLKWDDRVQNHMPEFELYDRYVTREVTVRDLLCHRVGLTRGDLLWYGSGYTRDQVLHRVRHLEPTWSFRAQFGYQNIMYLAAGQIIPRVLGLSWDDFIKQRLFLPLGMRTSNTSVSDVLKAENVATPHSKIDDKVTTIAWRDLDNVGPAGSINSNVSEMANWMRMQLGEGLFEGTRVVSADVVQEMQTPQMIEKIDDFHPDAHFLAYGLGWFLHDYHGRKIVEHGGAIDGMRAQVVLVPEENLGVVILINRDRSYLPAALCYRAVDLLLDTGKRDWTSEFLAITEKNQKTADEDESKQAAERVRDANPSLPLDQYGGTYRSPMYGDLIIGLDDGVLTYKFGNAFIGKLDHWHYDTFHMNNRDRWVRQREFSFHLNVDGKVGSLVLHDVGEFKRLSEEE